jgi:hypothetical protein
MVRVLSIIPFRRKAKHGPEFKDLKHTHTHTTALIDPTNTKDPGTPKTISGPALSDSHTPFPCCDEEHQGLPATLERERQRTDSLSDRQEGTNPSGTLISEFEPPGLSENKFPLLF